MDVICDYLDVTYSPDDSPELAVLDVLQAALAECVYSDDDGSSWRLNGGIFKFQRSSRFHRCSASGAVLDGLRAAGLFLDYLSALSESPHTVTRLDAAYDVPFDAPAIIARLRQRYPRECRLSHKPLPTASILAVRADGQETGTWYVGRKSRGRVTARVYDKRQEVLDRCGTEILPTTRYELTFKRDIGCTLRDAAEPARVFWHYASPALLKRPKGVPEWDQGWGGGWSYSPPAIALGGVLRARIQSSAELQAILALADRADCMEWCGKLLARLVDEYPREHGSASQSGLKRA